MVNAKQDVFNSEDEVRPRNLAKSRIGFHDVTRLMRRQPMSNLCPFKTLQSQQNVGEGGVAVAFLVLDDGDVIFLEVIYRTVVFIGIYIKRCVDVVLVALGGILYTIGAIVYATKWPNPSQRRYGFHEVFHSLTIAAFGWRCPRFARSSTEVGE